MNHTIANVRDQEVPLVRGCTRHTGGGKFARLMTLRLGRPLRERPGSECQLGPPLPFVNERKQERPAEPRRLGSISHRLHQITSRIVKNRDATFEPSSGRREDSDLPRERRTALDMMRWATLAQPPSQLITLGRSSTTQDSILHHGIGLHASFRGPYCSSAHPASNKRP